MTDNQKDWQEIRKRAQEKPLSLSKEEIDKNTELHSRWQAINAIEGIYPDDDAKEDLQMLIEGKMTPTEFKQYLDIKIKALIQEQNHDE